MTKIPVVVIDELDDIAVDLFLQAYQGFDPSLKSEGQKRIPLRQILVKLSDPLGLRRKEVVMLQKLDHLQQTVTVRKIDPVIVLNGTGLQIPGIAVQDLNYRIAAV